VRGLISQEQKYQADGQALRALRSPLEQTITKHFYEDEKDATDREKIFPGKKKKEMEKRPEQLRT
jgi:hypothetical protein